MDDLFQASEVLYWTPSPKTRNFGDYISDLFLDSVLIAPRVRASRYRLIGSIVDNENIERDLAGIRDGGDIAYWGCGARDSHKIRPDLLERCRFFGVRGPLTRDLLGLPADTVFGDPGLLLPLIRPAAAGKARHGKTVCIPHIFEPKSDEELAAITGAELVIRAEIAPTLKALGQLIDQITGAEFVLAGAMHAAVIAHAYGVPFAFFDTGHLDIPFKWRDFAASIGIPVVFIDNLQDGRTAYEDLIRSKAKRLPLLPILSACPYYVQPSVLVKAAAHDADLKVDARLLGTLKSAGFEAKAYTEAAERSDKLRDDRLKARFEQQAQALDQAQGALAAVTERLQAAEEALAGVEQESRDALAALASKEEERAQAEVACGRWMADAERLLGEVRALEDASAGLSQDLEASRKTAAELAAELDAQRRAFESELEAQRRGFETELGERRVAFEAKLGAVEAQLADTGAKLEAAEARIRTLRAEADRLETQLADYERRLGELEADKAGLAQALEASEGRARDLRFESRFKDAALPRGGAGPFAALGFELQLARARMAARSRKWSEAERRYAQILFSDPQNGRILVQYGHALKEQGELGLAASAYSRAFRQPGADFDLIDHLLFALRASGQGAAADAVERDEAHGGEVVIAPDRPPAERPPGRLITPLSPLTRLAAIRAAKSGDWTRAARKYDALVRGAPGHAPYWVLYGHALKEGGQRRQALAAYATALRLDPKRADSHLQLGHALKLLERRDDAERAYAYAFQLAPSDVSARRELEWMGKSQADLVQLVLEGAEARLQRADRLVGGSLIELGLAKHAAKKKNWPAAARRYRRMLTRANGDWRSWVQLGHALKEQGRLVDAEGAYLHALALEPGAADIHLQLGHALKLRGFRKEAADAYERASRLDPAHEDARRELEALRAEERRAEERKAEVAVERAPRAADEPTPARQAGVDAAEVQSRLGLSAREARILRELKSALSTDLN
jgi:cytochrome c-type biogenesis protein CcmH/NrfG